jgi:hypothetical protein
MRLRLLLALLLLTLTGCDAIGEGGPAGLDNDDDVVDLFEAPIPPIHGTQIHLPPFELAPGQEIEGCKSMRATNLEAGAAWRMELKGRRGLHHAVVWKTSSALEDFDVPCFGVPDQIMEGFQVPQPLFASSTQVTEEVLEFPPGVALSFDAEQWLVFNYHYINVTDEPIIAEAYLNVEFVAEEDLADIEYAGFYAFGAIQSIGIPAGGTQRVTTTCAFPDDVSLFSITPHLHKLGTGFEVSLHDGTEVVGEPLLQADGWFNAETSYLQPAAALSAGEGLTITCEWTNPTDQYVDFGQTTEDEMCFVFGFAWPLPGIGLFAFDYNDGCTIDENVTEP